jgi:hypothetical protein
MLRRLLLIFSLAMIAAVFTGCATDDPDNVSARPWNHPRGWESGLPPQMLEGR